MDNQNTTGTATEQQQEKTFTQDQVNAIVGKRLAEQKATLEADFVKREQELNKREMSIRAKELLAERGLPKDLGDVLRYDTEDELIKAIDTIEHSKGFKNADQEDNHNMSKGFKILENRLEKGDGDYGTHDPIANAFKLKGQ